MDYKEYVAGVPRSNFWHISKAEFIDIVLSKIKHSPAKILDVGCGIGNDLKVLKKHGNITVVDTNRQALSTIRDKRIIKKVGDICRLPFPDASFDLVVAFDVLEHIKNDTKAIAEIRRVLRPKGDFFFTVPAFPQLYGAYDKFLGHERRYTKKSLEQLLKKLCLRKIGYWNCFLFGPFVIERLLKMKGEYKPYALPKVVNSTFRLILRCENFLAKVGINMPIGLTLYGIARKE